MKKCCSGCAKWCDWNVGVLLIRLIIAVIFINAGWMKVMNMDQTIQFFSAIGINSFWTYVASYVELIAGVAVLLGVLIVPSALLLAIVMIVAIIKVGLAGGFAGYAYQLVLAVVLIALTTFGAGKYGIARFMPKWLGGGCCGNGCDCGGTCNACKVENTTSNPQA